MRVLDEYMRPVFEKKLTSSVRESFKNEKPNIGKRTTQPAEEYITAFVNDGIDRAEKWGIMKYADVRAYLELMLVIDRDFENDPQFDWITKIFKSSVISPGAKMKVIFNRLPLRHPEFADVVYPS